MAEAETSSVPDPRGGGAKGAHAPPPPQRDRESYLAPGKKIKKVKRHAKNWYKCKSNTCAFPECNQSAKGTKMTYCLRNV